jgi:hypothetical protein
MTTSKNVWVAVCQLNETIMAVGSTQKIAIGNCSALAAKYLKERDCYDDNGKRWKPESVADYFGVNSFECAVDGKAVYA